MTASDRAEAKRRPCAVIISKQRIVGATNGSSAYLIELARSIDAAGFDVHLLQPSPAIAGRTPFIRLRPEMRIFAGHRIRGARRIGDVFVFARPPVWMGALTGAAAQIARRLGLRSRWTVDRPRPYAVATPWEQDDLEFLASHLPAATEIALADYMFCTPAFAAVPEGTAKAIVMHDLFHARQGDGVDSVALVDRDEEIERLSRADAVIAIQEAERQFVRQFVPTARAILAPMPATLVDAPQPGADGHFLFVGSSTAPNVVGLQWFIAEVWPLVRRRMPEAILTVAGTVGRAFYAQDVEGIRFLGMVDDLAPLYREAGVVISPLTFGSGLKIKLVEGLAKGKAMVVTGVTLQGVEDLCMGALVRADDAGEFAQAMTRLGEDRTARSALAGYALQCARSHFSAEAAHAELRDWLRQAAPAV